MSHISFEAGSGLTTRGRVAATGIALLLVIALGFGLAAANALPFITQNSGGSTGAAQPAISAAQTQANSSSETVTLPPETIHAEWGGPTVNLDWTGAEYVTAETSFIGDRVASPGDRVNRTLEVRNDGPSSGILTVSIVPIIETPEGTNNSDLGDDIDLFWNVAGVEGQGTFSALAAQQRVDIAEVVLAQGETADVTIGFEMDRDVETSRMLGEDSTILRFGTIDFRLTGETEPLVLTGGNNTWFAAASLAALLLALGWFLLVLRQRQRGCEECSRRIGPRDNWVKIRRSGERAQFLCESCGSVNADAAARAAGSALPV